MTLIKRRHFEKWFELVDICYLRNTSEQNCTCMWAKLYVRFSYVPYVKILRKPLLKKIRTCECSFKYKWIEYKIFELKYGTGIVHDLPFPAFLRAPFLLSWFLRHWFQWYSSMHCTNVSYHNAQHKLAVKLKYTDTSFCSWYAFASLRIDSWELFIKFKMLVGIPNRFVLK